MDKRKFEPIKHKKRTKYGKEKYIGKKFKNWEVLDIAGTWQGTVYWKCKCLICNDVHYMKAYNIYQPDSSFQCNDCTDKTPGKGKDNHGWKGGEFISGWFFNHYIQGAKLRNLNFDLTVEEAEETLVKQNFRCAYTNIPIKTEISRHDEFTASIDRIDNNKGYTIDNIQWVHKTINKMKSNMTEKEFINWCKLVANNG